MCAVTKPDIEPFGFGTPQTENFIKFIISEIQSGYYKAPGTFLQVIYVYKIKTKPDNPTICLGALVHRFQPS